MITNNIFFFALPNRLYFSVTSLLEHSVAQPSKYNYFSKDVFDLSIIAHWEESLISVSNTVVSNHCGYTPRGVRGVKISEIL